MSELNRYSRQTLLPEVGVVGQERLLVSSVVIVGCGALGTVIASTLVRAGVGQVPADAADHTTYSMGNNAAGFPTGSAMIGN